MSENIFKSLREDHEVQRALVGNLINTSGNSRTRRELFRKLKEELSNHEKAEERFFYRPLICDDLTIEMARHSIAEHKELDDLVEELETIKFDSSAWLKKAKELEHRLHHHLEEEEKEIFPLAGKALSGEKKGVLAKNYNKEMHRSRMN